MTATVAVAVLALVISAGSLLVALSTYRRSGPRLAVSVWKKAGVGRGGRTFVITVVNAGHQAATIRDIGLESWASGQRLMARSMVANHEKIGGPTLGHRIEGMDFCEWEIEGIYPAEHFGPETPVRGVVEYIALKQGLVFTLGSSETAEFNSAPDAKVVQSVQAASDSVLDRILKYGRRNIE